MTRLTLIAALVALATGITATAAFSAAAPKPKPLKGTIVADGSSTVGPWTTSAAELFQRKHKGVRLTVGISGTGGGFSRFCRGETDLSNASRPIKQQGEVPLCLENKVRYVAFAVANDGIALVTSRQNTWARCLTVDELRRIWEPGSRITNWSQVRAGFPDVPLRLYGPGTDSGTFDFFTEKINGRGGRSRSDYTPSEDDNVLVQGVIGERGSLGYFGLSYYEENKSRLNVVQVDGGRGCVTPSVRTVQSGQYRPLARPLFIYAKRSSFRRPEVAAFLGFALNNQAAIAKRSDYVALTPAQARKARNQYTRALKQLLG